MHERSSTDIFINSLSSNFLLVWSKLISTKSLPSCRRHWNSLKKARRKGDICTLARKQWSSSICVVPIDTYSLIHLHNVIKVFFIVNYIALITLYRHKRKSLHRYHPDSAWSLFSSLRANVAIKREKKILFWKHTHKRPNYKWLHVKERWNYKKLTVFGVGMLLNQLKTATDSTSSS